MYTQQETCYTLEEQSGKPGAIRESNKASGVGKAHNAYYYFNFNDLLFHAQW